MTQQATISELLGAEHRWLDARFEQFRQDLAKGQVNAAPFEEAAKVLHRHIFVEEEFLFPEVEAVGLVGPTQVMAQEHGDICRFLSEIQDSIKENASPDNIQQAFDALRGLLQEHNFKEERILYPAADRFLGGGDLAPLLKRLKEAKPSSGWACRAHRFQRP